MDSSHIKQIASTLSITDKQVANSLQLFDTGATIPFVSRYRKEVTGGLDEVMLGAILEQAKKLEELDKRRTTILQSIEEQGKLTDELQQAIQTTQSLTELEDLYLPYKQKRKTKASIAREHGLAPLAKLLMSQDNREPLELAKTYVKGEVKSVDNALQGARDIIAEWVSEDVRARNKIRILFKREAIIVAAVVKGKEEDGIKYKDYFDYSEPMKKCPSHRLLAMFRGEQEGFLKLSLLPEQTHALNELEGLFIKKNNATAAEVKTAIKNSYSRLLKPSIETEVRNSSKAKADEQAINVFAENLRQLLLAPPLGQKRVLAIDPGYRTGCKVVCLDEQGNLLHNVNIYPHQPQNETKQAAAKISTLVSQYKIDAIAIGNGTAGRETEFFVKKIRFDKEVQVFVVSENGASVYSASSVAREEFPEYDVTVRGAVSIGRRLMDPLAELVKIDPKSIGIGQYQHDVDQKKLKESLDRVVESCVNAVGVNLNTASKHLLTYISGLGPQLAQNIVDYRKEHGAFQAREELKKVKRMGDKAFEQCAGFLRIRNGKNPLDNSAVHPESYEIVNKMSKKLNCTTEDLIKDEGLRSQITPEDYITGTTGLPTINDILEELAKPGRDPRTIIKVFEFAKGIYKIEDLETGMILPGIVTNITNFGAFVDIGVKQDGLVHISNMADRFISHPAEVVQLHQHVKVKVTDVDIARKRIQLSMKETEQ